MIATTSLLSSGLFMSHLVILSIGFVYIVFSSLLSAVFGGSDGDISAGDGDFEMDADHDTVSIFSPKVLAIFMVGFGVAGCISVYSGYAVIGSILWGLVTGVVLGAIGVAGLRLLARQRASSDVYTVSAVGRVAQVCTPIPPGGQGQVSLSINGQHMTYVARSANTTTQYLLNTAVKVIGVEGSVLIVQ